MPNYKYEREGMSSEFIKLKDEIDTKLYNLIINVIYDVLK